MWGGASYERIARAFAPVHERLVELVAPAPGERFLDLACGTGEVALIAARAGAEVTGLDFSPGQLEKARAAAADAGLEVRFDEADVQELPYADASFDVVVSAFGMIFAPDHAGAASELTRVCRPGARVAITSWPEDDWFRLNARLRPDYENMTAREWADEEHVRALLPELELAFGRGESTIAAGSAEELWQLLATSVPGLKGWLDTLEPGEWESAHREFLKLLAKGELTREYVLVTGTRR
ncbi:MAG TPA: methyltransferase domain-containing protein [Gaiellaceae bacterium]